MRDHFFLHYGWFFQNLRKEAVRTFMHTTVGMWINTVHYSALNGVFDYHRGVYCVVFFHHQTCFQIDTNVFYKVHKVGTNVHFVGHSTPPVDGAAVCEPAAV